VPVEPGAGIGFSAGRDLAVRGDVAQRQAPAPPPATVALQPGVTEGNGAAQSPISMASSEQAQRAAAAAIGVKAPPRNLSTNQPSEGGGGTTVVAVQKVGRNDPCHCGSGKKYKKCHGA